MNIVIPKPVNEVLNAITEDNTKYEAYITGGTIRNMVMGQKVKNYNISTNASIDDLKKTLKGYHTFETGKNHRTLSVVNAKFPVNIVEYWGKDHTLEGHLAEMDFTMNALAYSDEDGLIDYSTGLIDIRDKIIRANVGEEEVFIKDPLRILRAIRLSAEYGMRIDTSTKEYMFDNRDLLKNVAPERIRDEFSKILVCAHAEFYLKKYFDIFLTFIPELSLMENFHQCDPRHIYNALDHTLVTIKCIEPNLELRLAMLFHDIGKPLTFTQDENGLGHYKNHHLKSAEMARDILNRLKYNKKTIQKVIKLIEYHDYSIPEDEEQLKMFISHFGSENLEDLFKVKKANFYGKNPAYVSDLTKINSDFERIDLLNKQSKIKRKDLKITGKDIIELGIPQEEVGQTLDSIYHKVLLGELKNNHDKIVAYIDSLNKQENMELKKAV